MTKFDRAMKPGRSFVAGTIVGALVGVAVALPAAVHTHRLGAAQDAERRPAAIAAAEPAGPTVPAPPPAPAVAAGSRRPHGRARPTPEVRRLPGHSELELQPD